MNDVAQLSRGEGVNMASGKARAKWAIPRGRQAARPHPIHHYFAFLSYSHADAKAADWLHEAIEQFRVPRRLVGRLTEHGVIPRRLTPVFRDRGELAAADSLGEEIEEALAGSRFMIVLCSPEAAASKWTNAEIAAFKRLHPDGDLFAAIVGGEPFASEMPGREAEECFPPALLEKYDRRGRPTGKREEPIAADMREQGDGRSLGLMKIIAGMLGVGLDDLVQREGKRRQRRMTIIAAASLAGMVVTSGLSLVAIQSRDAARDQRREAEGLVAFMLGDLKDKLEPIGQLDALDGVGARVLAYYSKQDASELSDAALLQRSRALSLSAQVANSRLDLDTAQALYRQAMQGTGEAVRRNPNDPQRLFDHAQNVFWIGEIARGRGDMGQAETAYREYKRLADRMVAIEPDNLKWRMEVLYARENLGIVLMSQRRFAEAAQQFEAAIRPMESLASIDPANDAYQKELSNVLAWRAQADWTLGQLDAAITVRQQQVSLLERLLAEGKTDVIFRQQLIPAYQALGLLFTSQGQVEKGVEQYRLALAQANRLIQIEPENSLWRSLAAGVRLDLAKNLIALGRREEAAQEAAAACATVAPALNARDSTVARSRTLQTTCFETRSRLALAAGDNAQALALAERALAAARTERSGDSVMDRYRVAAAHRLVGDIHQRMGNRDAAHATWSAAIAQLPRSVAERPWEMSERAELLKRLGRETEARPIAERLAKTGYKKLV